MIFQEAGIYICIILGIKMTNKTYKKRHSYTGTSNQFNNFIKSVNNNLK